MRSGARRCRASLVLLLGLLAGAGLSAQATDDGWTWTEIPKTQPAPHAATVSADGSYAAEIVADTTAKVPTMPLSGLPVPPDLVVLRDAAGKALQTFRGPGLAWKGTQVAFSTDGAWLAVGGIDRTITLIDVAKRKQARRFPISTENELNGLAYVGPDTLLTLDIAGTVSAWNVKTGKRLATLGFDTADVEKSNPRRFLAVHDQAVFVARGRDLRRTGLDLKRWQAVEVLPARIVALRVTADGRTLAVGIDTKQPPAPGRYQLQHHHELSVRDAETLKERKQLDLGNEANRLEMALVPGRSDQVVIEEKDGVFAIWELEGGKKVSHFTHPLPRAGGTFSYRLLDAAGGKLKTYCFERGSSFGPPPIFPARLWVPPAK